jgi:hypothetical protein
MLITLKVGIFSCCHPRNLRGNKVSRAYECCTISRVCFIAECQASADILHSCWNASYVRTQSQRLELILLILPKAVDTYHRHIQALILQL